MSVSKIAGRYAKSLIDLGRERQAMDAIVADIGHFLEMSQQRDFNMFLKSPIINADKKWKVFIALLSGKVHPGLMDFFRMVIYKGRENILPEILRVVVQKHKEMIGMTTVVITSAVALEDKVLDRITEKLKKAKLVDRQVEYIRKIDPDVIGGFVIEIGDLRYDASIAGKVRKIHKELIAN